MGTISEVQNLAIELLNKDFTFETYYGTHTMNALDLGYYFEFNNKKRAFGTCHYVSKKISLSLPLCSENLDKIETRIYNTILHELAHAFCVEVYGIKYGHGHGSNWKSIAKQIGCDGERCFDGETMEYILKQVGMQDQMLKQLFAQTTNDEIDYLHDVRNGKG
jgi:hypothetical protein